LPKDCLILDFHYDNNATLGQEIPVAWNIQLITKGLTKPGFFCEFIKTSKFKKNIQKTVTSQ
jgi:hypothetical protein